MGLDLRLHGLKQRAPKERAEVIEGAAKRLIDKLGMGREYRVLGVVADGRGEVGEGKVGQVNGEQGEEGGEEEGAVWPFVGGEDA